MIRRLLTCAAFSLVVLGHPGGNVAAQESNVAQPDIRAFVEQSLASGLISASKAWVRDEPHPGGGQIMLVYLGSHSPNNLTGDPLLDWAINAQTAVCIIRKHRNSPAAVRDAWKSPLAQVEAEIQEILDIWADPDKSEAEKDAARVTSEEAVDRIYATHLDAVASHSGRLGWQPTFEDGLTVYETHLFVSPPTGSVKFMSAARWEFYQFNKKKNLPCPKPEWETVTSNPEILVGKYYFLAQFGDDNMRVHGPIAIHSDKTLVFTESGLQTP
jgi:hypothetical protein